MSTLQTRLFKLTRSLNDVAGFDAIGEHNLVTSITVEDGTLAMYSTHLPSDIASLFVFEVYASEEAYQVHAASPQFKAYVEKAASALTGREVITLSPELMLEKPVPMKITDGSCSPRCCFVKIKPDRLKAFRKAVFKNMRASIEEEPGVLVLYATSSVDDPLTWVFWEVYASEEAYEAHRETDHFKAYIAATADDLYDKELVALAADCVVSKGSLRG